MWFKKSLIAFFLTLIINRPTLKPSKRNLVIYTKEISTFPIPFQLSLKIHGNELKKKVIFQPSRTRIRNRCLRLKASG